MQQRMQTALAAMRVLALEWQEEFGSAEAATATADLFPTDFRDKRVVDDVCRRFLCGRTAVAKMLEAMGRTPEEVSGLLRKFSEFDPTASSSPIRDFPRVEFAERSDGFFDVTDRCNNRSAVVDPLRLMSVLSVSAEVLEEEQQQHTEERAKEKQT